MQIDWIKQDNNTNLLIIALGWGASPEVIENQLLPLNCDIVVIYDYRLLSYSAEKLDLAKYSVKTLIAWSFGVWASEQLFSKQNFDQAIAIAGTPYPIEKKYGINPRAFALTLQSVLNDGVVKFIVRMCGKHLREYLRHHSKRELTDIQEELVILNAAGQNIYTPELKWSKALIPAEDIIFPAKSQEVYWKTRDTKIEILPSTPHYPFYDEEFIQKCLINH